MKNKVVVTGIGIISPIGNNPIDFLKSLKSGKNGIKNISLFDTEDFNVKIAGEVNIDLENHFSNKELNRLDRFTAFSLLAADQAIKQSELSDQIKKDRIGVIIGSGIGGIGTFEKQHKRLLDHPKKVSPFFIPTMISDIAAGHISIKYGFRGINYGIVSACATGTHAVGNAYRQIKYGDADMMIAGGSEASITPISIAGFSRNPKKQIPRFHICQKNTPFLLAHGKNDEKVPVSASLHIYDQLIDQGANAELLLYNGKHKIGIECLRKIKKIIQN